VKARILNENDVKALMPSKPKLDGHLNLKILYPEKCKIFCWEKSE
jgi:hypothetical protein